MHLEHKNSLITGGSRGLGRALAGALSERGARVVLTARRSEELEESARALRAEGRTAHALAHDIADKEAIHALVGESNALLGSIDILINNASTLGPTPLSLLLDTECEDLERAFQVNVLGAFRLTKAVAGSMVLRGGGVIVNVSSDAAIEAYPTWGAYAASKAALDHLSRTWAAELDGSGVRVLSVDPGEMDTQMHAAAVPEADRDQLSRPRDVAARIVDMIAREDLAPNGARLLAQRFGVRS